MGHFYWNVLYIVQCQVRWCIGNKIPFLKPLKYRGLLVFVSVADFCPSIPHVIPLFVEEKQIQLDAAPHKWQFITVFRLWVDKKQNKKTTTNFKVAVTAPITENQLLYLIHLIKSSETFFNWRKPYVITLWKCWYNLEISWSQNLLVTVAITTTTSNQQQDDWGNGIIKHPLEYLICSAPDIIQFVAPCKIQVWTKWM